jgi:hypothetical protein
MAGLNMPCSVAWSEKEVSTRGPQLGRCEVDGRSCCEGGIVPDVAFLYAV